MKLRASDVLLRAAQRGYTADEIRPCLVKDLGNGFWEVDVEHPAYPKTPRPGYTPPAGLGDMIKAGLSALGITEERVSRSLGVKDCGCSKRAEALNRLGRRIGIG